MPYEVEQKRPCIWCGKTGSIIIEGDDAEARWKEYIREYNDLSSQSPKRFIQNAFPELTAEQREQYISGTHPKCWDEMFPDGL